MSGKELVDPNSYEPAYVQLAGILRRAISGGALPPGHVLPSQSTLRGEHGVSRETVRRAISLLRTEGLILTVHGAGSFVRDTRAPVEVVSAGPAAEVSSRMPTPAERRRLEIPEGVPVLVVREPDQPDRLWPADRTIIRTSTCENRREQLAAPV